MSAIRITLSFKVGDYGWSESYYHDLSPGAALASLETIVRELAKDRLRLCGAGVWMDFARLSDVTIRRDADDLPLNYFTISGTGDVVPPNVSVIKTALSTKAINPNLCAVFRVEASNKVYHGEHPLSGLPANIFTSDETLNPPGAWTTAADAFEAFITRNNFLFPNLDRTGAGNTDTPVQSIVDRSNFKALGLTPVAGDRVRIINAVVPGKRRGGSIVGLIDSVTGLLITYQGTPIPVGATAGPKTIAHREVPVYVAISNFVPDHASHRNRGRPLRSPRGRRRR